MEQTTTDTPVSPISDDAARAKWLSTGEYPTPSAATAESATATVVDQPASTDATSKGASETPDPAKETKATPGLDAREVDVRVRIARLKDDLALAEKLEAQLTTKTTPKQDATQESSTPAATGLSTAEYKRYLQMPDAPKLGDFAEIEEHTAAMALFIGEKVAESTFDRKFGELSKEATARDARMRDVNDRVSKADADYKAYLERTPDADTKINPLLVEIVPASLLPNPADAKPHNVLADHVMESGCPGELHEYFSTPEGTTHWQSLLTLAAVNPRAVAFAFGKLSARFDTRAAVKAATPPKTVSTAPEPVETLGKRPAAPTDDADAALAAGDFEAYARIQNTRDFQARRTA